MNFHYHAAQLLSGELDWEREADAEYACVEQKRGGKTFVYHFRRSFVGVSLNPVDIQTFHNTRIVPGKNISRWKSCEVRANGFRYCVLVVENLPLNALTCEACGRNVSPGRDSVCPECGYSLCPGCLR